MMDADVAKLIAEAAVKEAARSAREFVAESQAPTNLVTAAERQVERVVYQDPPWRSWRLWGGFWSVVTGILALPEVQAAIGAIVGHTFPPEIVPIVTAALAALWAIISKGRDGRPVGPA